jgi:hypothetical protein
MSFEKLAARASRLFFLCAFLLLGLALIERIANATGYTILRVHNWGRFLDVAVVLLVFVIAEQLREIREELKKEKGAVR